MSRPDKKLRANHYGLVWSLCRAGMPAIFGVDLSSLVAIRGRSTSDSLRAMHIELPLCSIGEHERTAPEPVRHFVDIPFTPHLSVCVKGEKEGSLVLLHRLSDRVVLIEMVNSIVDDSERTRLPDAQPTRPSGRGCRVPLPQSGLIPLMGQTLRVKSSFPGWPRLQASGATLENTLNTYKDAPIRRRGRTLRDSRRFASTCPAWECSERSIGRERPVLSGPPGRLLPRPQ